MINQILFSSFNIFSKNTFISSINRKFNRPMKNCCKCNANAKIKIKVLNYCNDCFINIFESKIFRTIKGLNKNSKICFVLSTNEISFLFHDLICKFFAKRIICEITIYLKNELIIEDQKKPEFTYKKLEEGISEKQLLEQNGYELLVYGELLEFTASKSLEMVCLGKGKDQIESMKNEDFRIINFFKDIKIKEAIYYMYLHSIHRNKISGVKNIKSILVDFLQEVDSKNSLSVFNILSTLKKL